ncbi:MAG: hypothetical protein WBP29_12375 [Candidatus Zixiibacteriota bacterium]
MKRWLFVAVCMCGLGIVNCGDSDSPTKPTDPTDELRELIAQTPRADEEAEMAALWMCGELVAPESTYVQVREGLKIVRRQYGQAIPKLREIKFTHPWSMRYFLPILTTDGAANYRAGRHFEIDSLTELLNGEIIDTIAQSFDNSFQVNIQFAGRLYLDSVDVMYSRDPNVDWINHYWIGYDTPNVYPWRLEDGRLTLLFREAWGDCAVGCIYSRFWYFRVDGDSIEYVGEFYLDGINPWPDWWDEAKAGYEEYRGWD